jgi:hypothetical protein
MKLSFDLSSVGQIVAILEFPPSEVPAADELLQATRVKTLRRYGLDQGGFVFCSLQDPLLSDLLAGTQWQTAAGSLAS